VIAAEATAIGITEALKEAQGLSHESRKKMSVELKRHIKQFDSSNWAQNVVASFKVLEKI
jgi:trehalose-6-phosphate synthase